MRTLFNQYLFSLLKIRIFKLKDLWLFLIGIIFVSMISGALGAFILGVTQEEFFLGEEENVLVVTESGTTTPFTGKVSLSLTDDIINDRIISDLGLRSSGLALPRPNPGMGKRHAALRGANYGQDRQDLARSHGMPCGCSCGIFARCFHRLKPGGRRSSSTTRGVDRPVRRQRI